MDTQLIEGVDPLPNDHELLAIAEAEQDPWGSGISAYRIAIKNNSGRVYRVIAVGGWGEFTHTVLALKKVLKGADEAHDHPNGLDGFDAILNP